MRVLSQAILAILCGSAIAFGPSDVGAQAAGDVWDYPPLTADPAALIALAKREPVSPGQGWDNLFQQETIVIEASGKARTTRHVLMRVMDQHGVEGVSEYYGGAGIHRVRIIGTDGSASVVTDPPLESAQGRRTIADVRAGVLLERVEEEEEDLRKLGGVIASLAGLRGSGWTRRWRVVIDAPVEMKLEVFTAEASQRHEVRNGRAITTVEGGPFAQSMLLSDNEDRLVAFTTPISWKKLAKAYAGKMDAFETDATAIWGGLPEILEIANRKVSESDHNFDGPQSNKGWSWEERSAFIVRELRKARVAADIALIPELGTERANGPIVPAMGIAIRVPIKGIEWVDAYFEDLPPGHLAESFQGRRAFLVRGRKWVTLPRLPSSANQERTRWRIEPRIRGAGRFDETIVLTGRFQQHRNRFDVRNLADVSAPFRARNDPDWREEPSGWNVEQSERGTTEASTPDVIQRSFENAEDVFGTGDAIRIRLDVGRILSEIPEWYRDPAKNAALIRDVQAAGIVWREPLVNWFDPFISELTIETALPRGFEPKAAPPDVEIRSGTLVFTRRSKVDIARNLVVHYRLDSGPGPFSRIDLERLCEQAGPTQLEIELIRTE